MICGVYSDFGSSLATHRGVFMRVKKNHIEYNSKSLIKYQPRTENQMKYVEYLNNPEVTVVGGFGPAGSGKTLFACHAAVGALKSGSVDKIIITRPLISVDDEQLGFLPGSIVHKMDPWTRPIFDILGEFYSVNQIRTMVETGVIEISPLAYMRGRTFKRCFIIADEMQNSSPKQMVMLTTRLGIDSKLVITGDLQQCDLNTSDNGLKDLLKRLKFHEPSYIEEEEPFIGIVELDNNDIKRSPIVSKMINIYR
jgi:phosphate starvation-inducible PhoH-like protein